MDFFRKMFFLFCFLNIVLLYGQKNAITHGDLKAELALRKIYHDAHVVSCKVFSKTSEADTTLIRLDEYDTDGKLIRQLDFEYNSEKVNISDIKEKIIEAGYKPLDVDIKEEDTFDFFLYSDDGSRMYLDDELLIDADGKHSLTYFLGTTILDKGLHKIKIE